jgi:cysteine desulfurase
VGTGEACRLLKNYLPEEAERIASLRQYMEEAIRKNIPECEIVASNSKRLPGTLNIIFPGIPADLLITRTPTLCMSIGSACSSSTSAPSHVFLAMGLTREQARCAVRISIGRYNTQNHIRSAIDAITRAISDIKANIA